MNTRWVKFEPNEDIIQKFLRRTHSMNTRWVKLEPNEDIIQELMKIFSNFSHNLRIKITKKHSKICKVSKFKSFKTCN